MRSPPVLRLGGLTSVAGRAATICSYFAYPTLYLICVDRNAEMLMELERYLKAQGIIAFETMVSSLEELQLEDSSLDCVFAFNAIHHFDFSTFLSVAGRALRKRGQLFIYTRTLSKTAAQSGDSVSRISAKGKHDSSNSTT